MITHLHMNETGIGSENALTGDTLVLPDIGDLPWDDSDALTTEVRRLNDRLSATDWGTARRFALLPFPFLDESRKELRRVLDGLRLDGVCIVPIVGRKTLDTPDYAPLIHDLDRRAAQLLIHPVESSDDPLANPRSLDSVLALARLLYVDRIRSMSRTTIILAHSHGVQSFLAENIGMLYYLQAKRWRMGRFLADYLIRKRLRGVEIVRNVLRCA